MAEQTGSKRDQQLREYTEKLEQGIREIFEGGEKYREYLTTISNLHKYSFNNLVLITMQKPDASYVAGYGQWQKKHNRHVVKGEKGIKIFAPAPFKVKKEQERTDPDSGRPLRGPDGKALTEDVEVTIPAFKVVTVFDVSQTDGKPMPVHFNVPNIEGDVQQYRLFRQALEEASPVPVLYEPMREGLDGFFRHSDTEHNIHINNGMSQVQTVAALVHEITHATLHDTDGPEGETPAEREARRSREEVEAESVAFVVSQHFGIETDANSFGYVANWSSDKELSELKASLDIIRKTASHMIDTIDARFTELKREHGIEDVVIEAEAVRVVPSQEAAVAYAKDYYAYMSAHNEDKGLPRYGLDEPDVVVAEISQEIIDGRTEDLRQTIRHTMGLMDGTQLDDLSKIGDISFGKQSAKSLLRRLEGFEKVEYVMPEIEQDFTDAAVSPVLSTVEQFGVDFYTFMNERRADAGNIPFMEGDKFNWIDGFEQKFRDGYSGIARMRLAEWASDPAHGEQAQALLSRIDAAEQEIYADWPVASMRDRREQFGQDLAELMRNYYERNIPASETERMAGTTPEYITHQIEVGYTDGLESVLREMAYVPEYENTAGRFYSRLAKLEPLAAREFDLGYGHMGNGLAVWNRLEEKDGDFVRVAHISPEREVTYYHNNLPNEVKEQIEETARTSEMNISATQDVPVFTTPPQPSPQVQQQAEPIVPTAATSPGPRRTIPHQNYTRFEQMFPEILTGEYSYLRLQAGEAFMPLDVQHLFDNNYSITHYYRQNGDSMSDPDMQVIIDTDAKTLNAVTFQQDNVGLYQQVYDEDGQANIALQRNLNSFLRQWLTNIEEQGYEKEKAHAIVQDETVEITFDENGQPVYPALESTERAQSSENLPDPSITPEMWQEWNERDSDTYPLHQDKALELFDKELSIYMVDAIGNESLAIDRDDIEQHPGMFSIDRDDWQTQLEFEKMQADVRSSEATKESELLHGIGDRYGIYQIENTRDTLYTFRSFSEAAMDIDRADYKLMYTDELNPGTNLSNIWERHNKADRPAGREMRSLSMSDIVVLSENGEASAYYVDDIGFVRLENFLEPERGPIHENVENLADELNDFYRNHDQHGYEDTVEDRAAHAVELGKAITTGQYYDTLVKQPLQSIMETSENGGEKSRDYYNAQEFLKRMKRFEAMHQPATLESHIRAAEMSTEDNYNMIDGIPNNTTPKDDRPTLAQLEQDVADGKQISIMDLAAAVHADEKESVLGRLADAKLEVAERNSHAADAPDKTNGKDKDERSL